MNEKELVSKLRAVHSGRDTTGFNVFDFIHAFGSGVEALMYAQLFWPEFVEFEGMIFLKTTIETEEDKSRIRKALKRCNGDPVSTEQSFNTVEVPNLFGPRIGETDDDEDRCLAEILAQTWAFRLQTLFSDRHFDVQVLEPKETGGEIAVAFSQKRKESPR